MRWAARLLGTFLTLWGAATVVFFLLRAVPGDPATAIAGEHATPEALTRIRERWNLDRPLTGQYLAYLGNLCRGELGDSIQLGRPVAGEIRDRFGATFELAAAATAIAGVLGLILGTLAAARRGTWVDALVSAFSMIGVSVPIFGVGYVLILVKVYAGIPFLEFSGRMDEASSASFSTGFLLLESLWRMDLASLGEVVAHGVLPALTLATVPLATIAKITRSGLTEALSEPYVLYARAKGLTPARILLAHALPNAAIGILTAAGLQFGYLLGGAVLTETVFAWPGLGKLLFDAVQGRDYPLIQGMVLVSCLAFLVVNAAVDFLYPRLDRRLAGP